jgi:hypothetical protein
MNILKSFCPHLKSQGRSIQRWRSFSSVPGEAKSHVEAGNPTHDFKKETHFGFRNVPEDDKERLGCRNLYHFRFPRLNCCKRGVLCNRKPACDPDLQFHY